MDAIRADRKEFVQTAKSNFTFYMAILLTKDIDMSNDNTLIVIAYISIITLFFWWFKWLLNSMLVDAIELRNRQINTTTSLEQLSPSMQIVMIVPLQWLISCLDLGIHVLMSKVVILLATVMQSLLPNSAVGNPQQDDLVQIMPPIMLFNGFLFLSDYSID